jgi:FtsP/CotA-like multicopper oxidase with cupredoxin domain
MDGVPGLTQLPIAPGETFTYEFDLPDAGTYWYHPHANSAEQVGRGLAGAIIVDEAQPPAVDRDLLWVLDDWRLDRDARIAGDFGHPRDASHAGRLGNTVTLNGVVPESLEVRPGERIRLRLVNVANARIFGLRFEGHAPYVIARDGQPVDPYPVRGDTIVLAPGERSDLIIDMHGEPGERFAVIDAFYPQAAYRLMELVYAAAAQGARVPAVPPARLADNPWKRPDVGRARRERIVIEGGMMGGFRGGRLDGQQLDARTLFLQGKMWALNGEVAGEHHQMAPLLTMRRGDSIVVELVNDSVWHHPMHLHGMFFEVISVDGAMVPRREGRDTLTLAPRGRAEVAFRGDAPGDWMFHCHILEHQDSGLIGVVRVT